MAKTKGANSKKGGEKSKTVEKPPERHLRRKDLNVLELPPPNEELVEYPFGERPKFPKPEMKKAYEGFLKKKVLTPSDPNLQILEDVGLLGRVKEMFDARGYGFVFDKLVVFPEVTREFVASFEFKLTHDSNRRNGDYVYLFRIGGKEFKVLGEVIDEILGIKEHDIPVESRMSNIRFWQMITKDDKAYTSNSNATEIKDPFWRLVHKIITSTVYMRKDKGRYVNEIDLSLMNHLNGTARLYLGNEYAGHLLDHKKKSFRGSGISGGNVATLFAMKLNFNLDQGESLSPIPISERFLSRMKIIKRYGKKGWHVYGAFPEEDVEDGNDEDEEFEEEDEVQPEERGRRRKKVVNGTGTVNEEEDWHSGFTSLNERFTTLELDFHSQAEKMNECFRENQEFMQQSREFMAWQGRMISGIYNHGGYPGFEPPPCFGNASRVGDQGEPSNRNEDNEGEPEEEQRGTKRQHV